jgi:drug/metabolite transporter (DMT)-like permease
MALVGALAAILIWSLLATLGVSLNRVPPLFLIGASLLIGGLLSLPWARKWHLRWTTVVVGAGGMFFYHLLFFLALRTAPPVSANLVHYTWPMLIVLLSPMVVTGTRLKPVHVAAAVIGFLGAALAIGGADTSAAFRWDWGYAYAIAAALVWSIYSLAMKRLGKGSPADVGLACILAGSMALFLHARLEPAAQLATSQVSELAMLGLGPMGAAFYLWAYALKRGDPRVVGVLANATPLLSTAMLVATGRGRISAMLIASVILVCFASVLVLYSQSTLRRRRVPIPVGVGAETS